jgi:hypothetical protein
MRPFFRLNILLLTFFSFPLSHAFLGLSFYNNIIPRQLPGCHHPTLGFKTYIHFYAPQDNTFIYSIGTEWRDTYDDILRNALLAHGFVLLGAPSMNLSETCHWKDLDKIWVAGIHRGDISYQDLPPFAISDHNVPRNEPRLPSNDTLIQIRSILLSNAPTHDLLMLILLYFLPFLGTALLLGPIWYIAHRRQNLFDAEDMDIELSSINAPDTPYQSTLDLRFPEKLKVKDDELWPPSYTMPDDLSSARVFRNQLDHPGSKLNNAVRDY